MNPVIHKINFSGLKWFLSQGNENTLKSIKLQMYKT